MSLPYKRVRTRTNDYVDTVRKKTHPCLVPIVDASQHTHKPLHMCCFLKPIVVSHESLEIIVRLTRIQVVACVLGCATVNGDTFGRKEIDWNFVVLGLRRVLVGLSGA